MKELYTLKNVEGKFYDSFLDVFVEEFNDYCIYSLDNAKYYLLKMKGAKIHPLTITVGQPI